MSQTARLALLIIACVLMPYASAADEPIAVIVNKTNRVDDLKQSELARIYKGKRKKWPDGQRILLLDRSEDATIRRTFYEVVLDAQPTQKFFRPGSPVPIKTMVTKSAVATRKFVARIPNAIGYVYLSQVDDTVKVLTLGGVEPGGEGYRPQE